MDKDLAISILQRSLEAGAIVMAPILLTGLVVGVSVAVVQAATQVNEPTLTFIPKIIAVGMVAGLVFPWGLDRLVQMVFMVMSHIADVP